VGYSLEQFERQVISSFLFFILNGFIPYIKKILKYQCWSMECKLLAKVSAIKIWQIPQGNVEDETCLNGEKQFLNTNLRLFYLKLKSFKSSNPLNLRNSIIKAQLWTPNLKEKLQLWILWNKILSCWMYSKLKEVN